MNQQAECGPFGRVILPTAESACELPLDTLPRPADFAAVFGGVPRAALPLAARAAPLIVEIGCGGGRTLIGMALARPECNFIGVERAGEYYRELRRRVERRKLANMRIARIDAAFLIRHYFPDASVTEYHIYFPDPWPKKRHHKRRLFTDEFCADLRRTLAPAGTLFFATDHRDYYDDLLPRLRVVLDVREHPEPWEDAPLGRTNFEVKYLKAGREIYRLLGKKQ